MALNFFFFPAGSWEKVVWRFCAPLVFDFLSLSAFAVYACSARLCLLVFQIFFFRAWRSFGIRRPTLFAVTQRSIYALASTTPLLLLLHLHA